MESSSSHDTYDRHDAVEVVAVSMRWLQVMKLPQHHHRQWAETTIAAPESTKKSSLQSFDRRCLVYGLRLPHPIYCSLFIGFSEQGVGSRLLRTIAIVAIQLSAEELNYVTLYTYG